MSKRSDYSIDLTTATPAALQGYILSAGFDEWLTKLDDQSLLDVERAFERASIKAANYRFCRAHLENARIRRLVELLGMTRRINADLEELR